METPSGREDNADQIARLWRELRDLQTRNQLGNSSVSEGATRYLDATGVEQARAGKLVDGTWGMQGRIRTTDITIIDGAGNALPLVGALLGQKAAKVTADVNFGSVAAFPGGATVLAKNTWHNDPNIALTVTVTTGRLDLTITARLDVSNAKGQLWAGFRLTGPTNVAPVATDSLLCNYQNSGPNMVVQASYRTLVEGLANGVYTVRPAYYLESIGGTDAAGVASNRAIIVQPL